MLPLLFWAALCWKLGLLHLSQGIVEGCVRTFGQLTWLATLLRPIFRHGVDYPVYVILYCLFLIVLAAYEASSRTKYDFEGQFGLVLLSLIINVGGVALFTFGLLLRKGLSPCPWNPRYVIPIVGMLLGNSIRAVALSLDALSRALVEQQAEIELYLGMGATPYQAAARLLHQAIATGASSILQNMRVSLALFPFPA
jgi:putative ABC transport system permease protein